jgi:hypothetical protein
VTTITTRLTLLRQALCSADAVELWAAVATLHEAGATRPLPRLGDNAEDNCRAMAAWLIDLCGPYPTLLDRQRLFRQRFGSQLQRRWFP